MQAPCLKEGGGRNVFLIIFIFRIFLHKLKSEDWGIGTDRFSEPRIIEILAMSSFGSEALDRKIKLTYLIFKYFRPINKTENL